MKLQRLHIRGLRCIADQAVEFAPGFNVLVGPNGAGKTSVLEAAFVLSHGRSFRSGARDALLARGASELSIFATVSHEGGSLHRLGMGKETNRWQARLDGYDVPVGEAIRVCAIVCFEPGSHELIAGSAEGRRRFLDWGVFHVEHEFLEIWRRYQRALKQRNGLLRSAVTDEGLFISWELELARAGEAIDCWRKAYLNALLPLLREEAGALLPELGMVELRYRRGWMDGGNLGEALAGQRSRDLARGHTSAGVHRADWSLSFELAPQREHLSRGQEKLAALACVLAQARLDAAWRGEWPVVCLDDLASELDQAHQASVVARLASSAAQVLVSGTEVPAPMGGVSATLFHVEQGKVTPLL